MNDDTIRNLIKYADDESENTPENSVSNGDTIRVEINEKTSEKDVEEAESAAEVQEEAPPEKSSLEQEEDSDEENFSSDSEEEDSSDEDAPDEEYDLDYSDDDDTVTVMPKKKKIVVYAITAVGLFLLMTVFSMIDTGVIGIYKKNFSANIVKIFDNMGIDVSRKPIPTVAPITDTSAISEDSVSEDGKTEQTKVKSTPASTGTPEYKTEVVFSEMVPFESASDSDFSAYKKGIVCAKTNYLCYIGPSGQIEWETATSVVDPILKAEGEYIFLAQNGGTKICLYENGKLRYDTDTDGSILSCAVSENGDAVTVMNRQSYKGAFSVYNKDGNEIYSWSSGSDLILSADISASSRRVAASLLNTDSKVKSSVLLFNINKENNYASAVFDDTVLFDIVFAGEEINAFGDNSMIGMNTSGKVLYDKRFDDVELVNYAIDDKGTKIMAFNSENIPMMNVYNSAGALKYTITTQSSIDYADIDSYNIIYNDSRDIFLGKPNSKNVSKYTAPMDIKRLILIDSRTFAIVYSNSLEFVRM